MSWPIAVLVLGLPALAILWRAVELAGQLHAQRHSWVARVEELQNEVMELATDVSRAAEKQASLESSVAAFATLQEQLTDLDARMGKTEMRLGPED